jgi:hypothetical protein
MTDEIKLKDVPYPECADTCNNIVTLGLSGCHIICDSKFDNNGDPIGASKSYFICPEIPAWAMWCVNR